MRKENSRQGGNRIYRGLSSRFPRIAPWIHLVLFALALGALDVGFRVIYLSYANESVTLIYNACKLMPFTVGWALAFAAVAALLPRLPRIVFMIALGLAAGLLCVIHGVYINMFGRFFSFADLAFAGDGLAFLDISYLLLISKRILLCTFLCFALIVLAALLAPPEAKPLLIPGAAAGALGIALLLFTRFVIVGQDGDVLDWEAYQRPAYLYEVLANRRTSLPMFGIYQYTFRDLQIQKPRPASLSAGERSEIGAYAAGRAHEDNAMTGLLEGKNLIMVQMEAIDTWMLEGYMPALRSVKEHSIAFVNHYTPAFIIGGTFNTEFMVNTGLLSPAAGIPSSVYTRNNYPNSMANLFLKKGYTANSFHGDSGVGYNRRAIHLNFGYEAYHSGIDMGMENYMMDSQMISAFDEMVSDEPFFTFIITYSGHGPYGEDEPIYQAHQEEARAEAARTDGNYVYAVAHAKETDAFVGELMERLETSGHLDDTAVVFYADHYDYYLLDDAMSMELKGVDSQNLLTHTDFFIYSQDLEPRTVEKYTSSLDVLPTLANLFGLDAQYELLTGYDAFSDAGGYVFFSDNTWIGSDEDLAQEIALRRRISGLLLAGNYWAGQG